MRLFLFNTMCAVDRYFNSTGQAERVESMCRALESVSSVFNKYDVLVFTEVMLEWVFVKLENAVSRAGFVFSSGFDRNWLFANTGIVIFAKEPVDMKTEFFRSCAGTDCLAYKGVKFGFVSGMWLYLVHLQSGDTEVDRTEKLKQLKFVDRLITRNKHRFGDPVMIVGDFNSSLTAAGTAVQQFAFDYGYVSPRIKAGSLFFSFDSARNSLVGLDGIQHYRSGSYPKGCVEEYKNQRVCVCCQAQLLDFALFSTAHRLPDFETSTFSVIETFDTQKHMVFETSHGPWKSRYFSDHFPVEFQINSGALGVSINE